MAWRWSRKGQQCSRHDWHTDYIGDRLIDENIGDNVSDDQHNEGDTNDDDDDNEAVTATMALASGVVKVYVKLNGLSFARTRVGHCSWSLR